MEKKYVVPDGMQEAAKLAFDASGIVSVSEAVQLRNVVEAVLKYQAEHPPVPSNKQITELGCNMPHGAECNFPAMAYLLPWWMRIAYLAPEPEIPQAVKPFLWKTHEGGYSEISHEADRVARLHNETAIEAFNAALGLRAGRQR